MSLHSDTGSPACQTGIYFPMAAEPLRRSPTLFYTFHYIVHCPLITTLACNISYNAYALCLCTIGPAEASQNMCISNNLCPIMYICCVYALGPAEASQHMYISILLLFVIPTLLPIPLPHQNFINLFNMYVNVITYEHLLARLYNTAEINTCCCHFISVLRSRSRIFWSGPEPDPEP
jgi:hypothetical protein